MQALIEKNHMEIPWEAYLREQPDLPIGQVSLLGKASFIGRIGLQLLSCGTGAWRVRSSMNTLAHELGVSCSVDIGLLALSYSCFDGVSCVSQTLSLSSTGVNTARLSLIERFVREFSHGGRAMTCGQVEQRITSFDRAGVRYTPLQLGLASALACCGFTFLLGGGPVEMLLAFFGAGVGNGLRAVLTKHRFTLFMNVVLSVAAACLTYDALLRMGEAWFGLPGAHEAGYICAMLFIIPGFPFITSGIDLAKQDFRSGIERLAYAVIIVFVAALTAWSLALVLDLHPVEFRVLALPVPVRIVCRFLTSFCGVFGFSIMFNSPLALAAGAGLIGSVANTLRLELVTAAGFPPASAAFCGALVAGLLASVGKRHAGVPRIAITVPSIVIMVPGLYFYRSVYHLGMLSIPESASWFASALLILCSLPLGLITARILTDRAFRYCS